MPTTIRARILETISKNQLASASELSVMLGVTKPNIQYHLKILLRQKVIEAVELEENAERQRGRPVKYYKLTADKAPHNFSHLCQLLLKNATQNGNLDETLNEIAAGFSNERIQGGLTHRVSRTVELLNKHHYQAHWEIHQNGPRIMLRNCPYAQIIADFPKLCEMDRCLLGKCLNAEVYPLEVFDTNIGIPLSCVFEIRI